MQPMNSGFARYVKKLSDDHSLCDVTIIVDNDEKYPDNIRETAPVQAHRLVLSVMCDFFRERFNKNSTDDNRTEIRLAGVPYSIFQKCLRFMYHGFDSTLSSMTLEDGIKFYSIARILQMETKVKEYYSTWLESNISKWERQIWTIFSTALECDLQQVLLHCKNYVTDVANELLFFDEFRTVPLSIVRMVLSCENLNCTKAELRKAIICWISANHIDDTVEYELLNSVRFKKDPLFKGEEVKFYKSMKMKELGGEGLNSTSTAPAAAEYSYSSEIRFRESVTLMGVSVFFKRAPNLTQAIQNVTNPIDVDLEIDRVSPNNNGATQSRLRTVVVDIENNSTQRNAHKVSIFFPKMRCDAYSTYKFRFSYKGEGVQPVLHMFGPIAHELVTARKSLIWSIYQQQLP